MILRSITKHVRDQNWFAVFLDFFIVVVGVFIGIQVANWNDERQDKAFYVQALARLQNEVMSNITIIDNELEAIDTALAQGRAGLDILITCEAGENAMANVNVAIAQARGTRGIEVQSVALRELTSNSTLLAQQSYAARKRFAENLYYINLTRGIAERFEPETYAHWPADTPTLVIASPETVNGVYFGIDYEVPRYPLVLNVPIAEACKDKALQKWLLQWEAWQTNVGIFNKKLRQEYQATLALLQRNAP